MFKHTPNPPESETDSDPVSPCASIDSKKLHEAADRTLDHYLKPAALKAANTPRKPSTMYMVAPDMDTESLLTNACESMASASVMLSDFADLLEGPHRNKVLGIQQIIMLGELAVNRALDKVDPQS